MDQFERARQKSAKRTEYYQSRDPNYGKTFTDPALAAVVVEPVEVKYEVAPEVVEPPRKKVDSNGYVTLHVLCGPVDATMSFRIRQMSANIPLAQQTEANIRESIRKALMTQFGNFVESV